MPPSDADDLWFVPAAPDSGAPTDPPWPFDQRAEPFAPDPWLKAESKLARPLAGAAATVARLDEYLRDRPAGLQERLALIEVSEQLWAQGNWVDGEKLALYRFLRLSTVKDAQYLSQADWAMRRMLSRHGPQGGLAAFLGRHSTDTDGLQDIGTRPVGPAFAELEHLWRGFLDAGTDAHPLTRAAIGFFSWRALGLSETGAVLEPMAAISGIGTEGQRGPLGFLPVAMGDKYLFARSGTPLEHLRSWFTAIHNGALRCLLHLERLDKWRTQAEQNTRDQSGRTPPVLIRCLLNAPLVSTDIIAKAAQVSKVAAHRNLALFAERGLIREVTGKERYRFWAARL